MTTTEYIIITDEYSIHFGCLEDMLTAVGQMGLKSGQFSHQRVTTTTYVHDPVDDIEF